MSKRLNILVIMSNKFCNKLLINLRPIVLVCLELIFGILASYFLCLNKIVEFLIIIVLFLSLLIYSLFISLHLYKKLFSFILTFFMFIFAIFGFMSAFLRINNFKNSNYYGHYYNVECEIEKISSYEYTSVAVVKNVALKTNISTTVNYKIKVNIQGKNNFKVGDKIYFNCRLSDVPLIKNNVLNFNYLNDNIKYYTEIEAKEIIFISNNMDLFEKVNFKIKETLQSNMPQDEFSIAYALLTGNSDYIEQNLLQNFRNAGVAHIFAVSGLHIGILAFSVYFILRKLKIKNIYCSLIASILCFLYCGICGFSPSSLRATIMFVILSISTNFGQKYDPLSSVFFAALIILSIKPFEIFTVGFQLSFGVVLGIILLSGKFKKLFYFLPNKISSALSISLSSQIVSVPIFLYAFQNISIFSVICNLIFVPFVSIIFILLFFSTFLAIILNFASFILLPSCWLLKCVSFVMTKITFPSLLVNNFSVVAFSILYYLILVLWSNLVNLKIKLRNTVILILIISLTCGSFSLNFIENKKITMYITSEKTFSSVFIENNNSKILFINNAVDNCNFYKLNKIFLETNNRNIDSIILANVEVKDKPAFLYSLSGCVKAKTYYFYGKPDSEIGLGMDYYFDNLTLKYYEDKDYNNLDSLSFKSLAEGKALKVIVKNKSILLVSKLENESNEIFTEGKENFLVATNFCDYIFYNIASDKKISFCESYVYENAENNDYLKYKFL